jgi:O-antigen/teichoic acid export membrane protein
MRSQPHKNEPTVVASGVPAHGAVTRASRTKGSLFWNFAGVALPALASLLAIPTIVGLLGKDRFGLLTLSWLLVSYFSLFDLGLTRALTRFASKSIGAGRTEEIPGLFATAWAMMSRLSILGAAIAAAVSVYIVCEWLKVPAPLRTEALWSFWIMSASLPFLISTGVWRALLEAQGRFDLANKLQIPVGVLSAIAPIAALKIDDSLVMVAALLAAIRVAAWAAHRQMLHRVMPALALATPNNAAWRRDLLKFGGWMTVSNALGPIMVYLDRFLIGGALSLSAIAYYTTSYELVTRAWLLVGAVMGVLLPAITASLAVDVARARHSYGQALLGVFAMVLAPLSVLSIFATEVLGVWLGADFAANGASVLRILAAGVLVNCMAQVSLTVVHAGGRSDWIAKLHLMEIVPYVLLLWWLVNSLGIVGVALAWTIRAASDALAIGVLANKVLGHFGTNCVAGATASIGCAVILGWASLAESIVIRGASCMLILIVCVVIAIRVSRRASV